MQPHMRFVWFNRGVRRFLKEVNAAGSIVGMPEVHRGLFGLRFLVAAVTTSEKDASAPTPLTAKNPGA